MISDASKRLISFGVFGFGIFGGAWSCVTFATAALVVTANDNIPEVLALAFTLATPLPACVLALWQHVIAGSWLIFAGCFLPYGLLVAIGLFGVLTGLFKWPKLLGNRRD